MTCVVAVKDDNRNVYIGSDLTVLMGYDKVQLPEPKWVNFGGKALIGCSGLMLNRQYLAKLASDKKQVAEFDFSYYGGVIHFSDYIKAELVEDGISAVEEGSHLVKLDGLLMIATPDKIWLIAQDFAVLELTDFGAVGSGSDLAYGAYYSYLKTHQGPVDPLKVIELGIGAANTYNAGCGGHSQIVCVKDLKEGEPDAVRNRRKGPKRKRHSEVDFH